MALIKIIFISFLFCYSLNLDYLNLGLQLRKLKDSNPSNDSIINRIVQNVMKTLMKGASSIKINSDISFSCKQALENSFFILGKNNTDEEEVYLAYYYYSKLITDSSSNVNDLSSYSNCMYRNHQYDFTNSKRKPLKPLYLTVFADYRKFLLDYFRNGNRTNNYLIGVCFVQNCSDEDYKKVFSTIIEYMGIINENDEDVKLKVYSLNKEEYKPGRTTFLLKFIPLYIIIIHLLIVLFHKYVEYLFKKIKNTFCETPTKRKIIPRIYNKNIINNIEDADLSPNVSFTKSCNTSTKSNIVKPHQTFRNYIKALFNVENNFDFLTKKDDKNEIHNNSSLSYMNGIKGISMITSIFGFVFINLYNAPITRQTAENYYDNMSNPFFFIFYFGIKYAPKLLLCSSGFSLFYKFMCFLDNKFEAEYTIKKIQDEEKKTDNNITNIDTSDKNISNRTSSNYSTSSQKSKEKFSSKYYFIFIASQIHKYILYLLILFFILFSLFDFGLLFIDLGPMWNFFNKNAIKSSYKLTSILPSIFCFQGYFFNSLEKDSILNYFYLVYQEVIYFIISTLVIFLGYKYNLRIDKYLLCTIILLWLLRIIYYNITDDLNVKEYFSFYSYFLFYNSLIYNYGYYLFGIYFGCLNYVIQKRYNDQDCNKNHKTYLLVFAKFIKIIKQKTKLLYYTMGILFLIIIIILTFDQYLLFMSTESTNECDNENKIQELLTFYNDDKFISVIMSIDTDIVVVLVNLMAFFFYLKGDNFIYDFLNLNFWGIFNKIYFSFILLINPVILYVFYITESRINFNMQNCYVYSFACGILLFNLVILVYSILELPFKKTIRLYLKRNEIKVGQKALGYMQSSGKNIIYKQMDIIGELIKSKDDSGSIGDDKVNDKEGNNEDYSEIKLEENFIENESQNEKE